MNSKRKCQISGPQKSNRAETIQWRDFLSLSILAMGSEGTAPQCDTDSIQSPIQNLKKSFACISTSSNCQLSQAYISGSGIDANFTGIMP